MRWGFVLYICNGIMSLEIQLYIGPREEVYAFHSVHIVMV